ncbi:hypothetical protein AVEN_208731-1 [Araneus ventricosus]|uniref:Uncharacterized protein n=1 Tax=Araneus ventricosus TaxID=182803 RepID=A0A4Y2RQ67_ARAVE|nr:hypothetical protein AVEN_208731-1 [Araneus ventricosus]
MLHQGGLAHASPRWAGSCCSLSLSDGNEKGTLINTLTNSARAELHLFRILHGRIKFYLPPHGKVRDENAKPEIKAGHSRQLHATKIRPLPTPGANVSLQHVPPHPSPHTRFEMYFRTHGPAVPIPNGVFKGFILVLPVGLGSVVNVRNPTQPGVPE